MAVKKQRQNRRGGLGIEQRRRGGGRIDPDLEAFREQAVRNPAAMTPKQRWELRRRRVAVKAPKDVVQATRAVAEMELTTLSQAATALQMLGLLYLVRYRGGLYFLPGWRQETNHPRVPYRLGVPRGWLDFIAAYGREGGGGGVATDKVVVVLGMNEPVAYPPLQRVLIDSVRDEDGWMSHAAAAAQELLVPAGHLLGVLQTAGVLVYAGGFAAVNEMFREENRRIARNNQDLFHLVTLGEWSPILGPMLSLAVRSTEVGEELQRAAARLAEGHPRAAAKIVNEARSRLARLSVTYAGRP